MKTLRALADQYLGFLVIPLWAGLLSLPFSGIGNAARIVGALVVVMLLKKMWGADAVAVVRGSMAGALSRADSAFSSLSRFASVPAARALLVVLLIVLPVFLNDYYRDIMTLTGMYVVLALGLNIVVGQAGLLNLGYVAFYAIGAYTYAILSKTFGLSFWPGLVAGGSAAAICAVLLGLPTLRLRGDYFAIVTLGLGEITRIVLNNWDSMTGGPNGISKIGRPALGGYVFSTT